MSRYSVERRMRHRPRSGWSNVADVTSLTRAITVREDELDRYEPGEFDGRLFAYRIIDNESGSIVQCAM